MSEISHLPIAPNVTWTRAGGDVIDRHRHDHPQLIYVSSGVLAINTERGSWIASRDRAVWVPAGVWHEHRFYGESVFHTARFGLEDAAHLPTDVPSVVAVDPLLRELLIAYTDPAGDEDEGSRMAGVLKDRLRRAAVQPLELPSARDPRLADACRLVQNDLRRPRSIASLAGQVGAGERTLSRLFRAEFGMTYPQWRTRVRVFSAMVMLAEGATVTEAAHACGWATPSAFVDTFSRTMGTTPGAYRAG